MLYKDQWKLWELPAFYRSFLTMASNTNIFAYRGRLLLSTYNDSQHHVPDHKLSDLIEHLHDLSAQDESDERHEPRKLDESDESYGSGGQSVGQSTGVPHGVRVSVERGVRNDRYHGHNGPHGGGEFSGGVLAGLLNPPVCIIGAGMAGLYTAMILESLMIRYHIVDANTRERVGGRVFTYKFPNGGPYDYFVSKVHPRSN